MNRVLIGVLIGLLTSYGVYTTARVRGLESRLSTLERARGEVLRLRQELQALKKDLRHSRLEPLASVR
jgi:hypothetical protein